MTITEILNEIYKNDFQDEVFTILAANLINEKNKAISNYKETRSTLKLISKVTKDKTVLDILAD